MANKRYFLVFYQYIKNRQVWTGDGYMETNNGAYLNRETTADIILNNDHTIEQISFTNIIELTQKDYEIWQITR